MANTYTNHKGIKAALTSPPTTGHLEHKDTLATGLYLRVYSTGLGNFIHRYKIKGIRRVYTFEGIALNAKSTEKDIATALTKVRALHQEQRNQLATGLDVAIERDLKAQGINAMPTLSEFAHTFIELYAKPNKKSWESDQRYLHNEIIPALGLLTLDQVQKRHITALLDRKQQEGAPITRNRLISLLSTLFNFAIQRGHLTDNPMKGIKRSKEASRTRVLNDKELKLFWNWTGENSTLSPVNRLALRLVLATGQRAGEVCKMTKDQLQGNVWTIPDTKNGLPHTVPLTSLALSIIEEAKPHSGDKLIFPNSKGAMLKGGILSKAMKRMKWQDEPAKPHDLRRTMITGISKLGFNRLVQDKIANHKDNSVGGIYDRNDYQKEKRQALEAWERHIKEILTGEPVSNVVAFKTA